MGEGGGGRSEGELNSIAEATKAIAPTGFVKQAVGTIKER